MPKDALTIYRAACELDFLVGGRVDKVTMPNADTVILLIHTQGCGNHRLLLSCNPSLPRVHITTLAYKNPEVATGTLMYFRKRLVGATLTEIKKFELERMITFEFSALDELRERVRYSLVAELTGKCANIVFVEENGIIGNALRKISAEAEGKRAVLQGLKYTLPNPTGRIGVFDGDELKAATNEFCGLSARAAVNKCVAGLAVTTVDELFFKLGITDEESPTDGILDRFINAAQALYSRKLKPCVTFDDNGKPLDYFAVPYDSCGGNRKYFDTLNAAMDEYYSALFSSSDFTAYSKPLRAAVKSAANKNKRRLADASQKLTESEECDRDKLYGELITANIYRVKRGDTTLVADNYYDNNAPVTIPLDPLKNAQQNAAAYYKAYNKKKKAAVYAKAAIDAANDALYILDGISTELDLVSTRAELDEIRAELVGLGLIRPEKKRLKTKPVQSEPYTFDVFGAKLTVGKNHAQNDRITRSAAKTDTWLHVKDAHGSHAVLSAPRPTDEQLTRAAEIAAYYSQSRGSENVAVDYTLVKHVFPHGGGRVEYINHKTIYVTPKN